MMILIFTVDWFRHFILIFKTHYSIKQKTGFLFMPVFLFFLSYEISCLTCIWSSRISSSSTDRLRAFWLWSLWLSSASSPISPGFFPARNSRSGRRSQACPLPVRYCFQRPCGTSRAPAHRFEGRPRRRHRGSPVCIAHASNQLLLLLLSGQLSSCFFVCFVMSRCDYCFRLYTWYTFRSACLYGLV